MTQRATDDITALLTALAEPTRRQVFETILAKPGITTSELASGAHSVTRWAVMKHLEVLRSAGLVQTLASGRSRHHYAERAAFASLRAWLEAMGR